MKILVKKLKPAFISYTYLVQTIFTNISKTTHHTIGYQNVLLADIKPP